MKYTSKTFSVPATTPTKRPCGVHHFVKGKCLRCDQKVTGYAEITPGGRQALADDHEAFAEVQKLSFEAMREFAAKRRVESVPTDAEGAE